MQEERGRQKPYSLVMHAYLQVLVDNPVIIEQLT